MSRMVHISGYPTSRNIKPVNNMEGPDYTIHTEMARNGSSGTSNNIHDINDFILVKNEHKMIKLQVKDIIYIEGKGNYVSLITTRSRIMTLQTMKNLESFLLPYLFIRVHKSFLVSFHHVEAIDNNTIWIRNTEIPIGDSYRESLRTFLNANTRQL